MGGTCVTLAYTIAGSSSSWDVQITTYDKDFTNKAPTGCTQYFYGSTSQAIKTFNWAGGEHLANQNQRICIRYMLIYTLERKQVIENILCFPLL